MEKLRAWAGAVKRQTLTLYYATRDPRTPWYAKAVAGFFVAYALSPIDLVPDFIPVLGYLDELILLPMGLWLALRLIPAEVLTDARARAEQATDRPTSRMAAALVILLWLALAAFAAYAFLIGL